MVFHSSIKESAHQNYVIQNAQKPGQFFSLYQRSTVCPQQHWSYYSAKTCAQLRSGVQLGPYIFFTPLEKIQPKFLRATFQVAPCIPNVILRKEAGLFKVKIDLWTCIIHGAWSHCSFLYVWVPFLLRTITNQYGSRQSHKNFNFSAFPGRRS